MGVFPERLFELCVFSSAPSSLPVDRAANKLSGQPIFAPSSTLDIDSLTSIKTAESHYGREVKNEHVTD